MKDPSAAEVQKPTNARKALWSPWVVTAYLLFCLYIQASAGAWDAAFDSYPDEPSHFIGAVMIRDAFASGNLADPLQFAQNYYSHYPYFAIGYWPPLFYIVTGLWFLAVGVGRLQALLIAAGTAAGTALFVFSLARKRAGILGGFCAGLLFLSLPEVQRLTCAVMVDEMVALFCLAVSVRLLRYFEQPTCRNAIYCGLCCACAILTKYSSIYVCALPLAATVCLQRLDLLRKVSFYTQYIVVGSVVAPWLALTAKFAAYGLPHERAGTLMERIVSFPLETLRVFPLPLAAFLVIGLLAVVVMPRIWKADLLVMCLLCLGLLTFLTLSPVAPSPRYLLVAAASLLVLSFAGWAAIIDRLTRNYRGGVRSAAVLAAALSLPLFAITVGNHKILRDPIRPIVRTITENPAWENSRIVVAQDLEGPIIAEFAIQDHHRPSYILVRPDKSFAAEDWFGGNYSCKFHSAEELMAYLRNEPVDLIIWREARGNKLQAHQRLMKEMLTHYPLSWHKVPSIDSGSGTSATWTIYEYVTAQAVPNPAPLRARGK